MYGNVGIMLYKRWQIIGSQQCPCITIPIMIPISILVRTRSSMKILLTTIQQKRLLFLMFQRRMKYSFKQFIRTGIGIILVWKPFVAEGGVGCVEEVEVGVEKEGIVRVVG